MTQSKQQAAAAAETAITRALLRDRADLSDNALAFLLTAARETIEYRSHLAGEALDVSELVGAVRRSDAGQLVFANEADEASDAQPDHVAATRDMTPQQRINYARQHGLR